jgi:PAS domain-containing protein
MSGARQKSLVLILTRDLASKLATPAFLVDAVGDLVYFNEAAEGVLGRPFVESQQMSPSEWGSAFHPMDDQGNAIPLEEQPLAIALTQRRPAHRELVIEGADGVRRDIAVTAVPLWSRADAFEGGLAVFWERREG